MKKTRNMPRTKIYARFSHNQVGMLVEISYDKLSWTPLDLYRYYPSLDTHAAEQRFLAVAENNNFDVEVVVTGGVQ